MCVCVCVCSRAHANVYVCVCVCVCAIDKKKLPTDARSHKNFTTKHKLVIQSAGPVEYTDCFSAEE